MASLRDISTSNPITALLVDDQDELRSVTREHLEDMGITVIPAANGEAALECAEDESGINLLISDVDMPGITGIELCDRLLADRPDLPVLLISSRGGEPEVQQRLALGDVAFLAKPFAAEELAAKVREAFECADGRQDGPRRTPQRIASPPPVMSAPISPKPTTTSRRFPRFGLRALAAIALVLGFGVLIRSFELGAPALPSPAPAGATRSLTIEVIRPLGPLLSTPSELAWKSVEGTRRYSVSLREIDGSALWQTEVDALSADLPMSVQGALHPAVTYYWSVEALDGEGQLLGRSELAPFVIEPETKLVEPTP